MADSGVWQPLPFTQALDRALVLTRRHFRRIYLPVAVPLAVCATLMVVAQLIVLQPLLDFNSLILNGSDPNFSALGCGAFAVLFLAYLVLSLLTQGVLFFAATDALEGRPVRMGAAWRAVAQPAALGTLILFAFALGAGFLLCILPVVLPYALFLWALPVMRSEGLYGFAALGRSAELARHRPLGGYAAGWKVLGAGLMGVLLHYLTSFLVQFPFQMILIPLQIRQVDDPTASLGSALWLNVPMTLVGTLVMVAVSIYVSFAQVLLYIDTQRRMEGGDLEAAVDGLLALHGVPLRPPGEPPTPGPGTA